MQEEEGEVEQYPDTRLDLSALDDGDERTEETGRKRIDRRVE